MTMAAMAAPIAMRGHHIPNPRECVPGSSSRATRAISSCKRARIGFGISGATPNSARRAWADASRSSSIGFFGSGGMAVPIRRQMIAPEEKFVSRSRPADQGTCSGES